MALISKNLDALATKPGPGIVDDGCFLKISRKSKSLFKSLAFPIDGQRILSILLWGLNSVLILLCLILYLRIFGK